jgi:hypothetical protein
MGGFITDWGYGRFNGQLAHRTMWRLVIGPIPDALCVLHRCDNPPCVNPSHLFLGTNLDNRRDSIQKGRAPKGDAIHSCKLAPEIVRAIRASYKAGGETHRSIGQRYGVDHTTVGDILRGETWQHVEDCQT